LVFGFGLGRNSAAGAAEGSQRRSAAESLDHIASCPRPERAREIFSIRSVVRIRCAALSGLGFLRLWIQGLRCAFPLATFCRAYGAACDFHANPRLPIKNDQRANTQDQRPPSVYAIRGRLISHCEA
jgi:hypothetical protein